MKLRVAVVEDEAEQTELLKKYLRTYAENHEIDLAVETFSDGIGITAPYIPRYDLIILDIQMKYQDGFKTAQIIRGIDSQVVIMFVTNMIQYALKGYEVSAFNFLLKPVDYTAFSKELDRIVQRIQVNCSHTIILKNETSLIQTDLSSILYAEKQGRKCDVYTTKGTFQVSATMSRLEDTLNDPRFFRIHSGFLVNVYKIEKITKDSVLINGSALPLSKHRVKDLLTKMAEEIGGLM
jgi:Response regulator of the LytR/AlgR family